MFVLKDHFLRLEYKNPLGVMLSMSLEKVALLLKRIGKDVVSVGDYTTAMLIKNGITPKIAIIDFKIMRKNAPRELLELIIKSYEESPDSVIIEIENMAGTINPELLELAELATSDKERYLILIKGEEDLLAVPFIILQNNNMVVVYGQPYAGSVLVIPSYPQIFELHLLSMERINLYSSILQEVSVSK